MDPFKELIQGILTGDEQATATKYGFDADGNPITVTDALGKATTSLYNAVGRSTEVIDPLGYATQYQFDAEDGTMHGQGFYPR